MRHGVIEMTGNDQTTHGTEVLVRRRGATVGAPPLRAKAAAKVARRAAHPREAVPGDRQDAAVVLGDLPRGLLVQVSRTSGAAAMVLLSVTVKLLGAK